MKDQLTGLDGFEEFIPKLQQLIDNVGDRIIAVIYNDVKHFKYFNDTYGYQLGNQMLAELAEQLTGESEFFLCGSRVVSDNIVTAAYFKGKTETEIYDYICERNETLEKLIRSKYKCNRIRLATGVFFITAQNSSIDAQTAVSNANLARKQSKESRGECVILFTDSMADQIIKEIEILTAVEDAIENREFVAYYQPKIDSGTGKITGAEALVRWMRPDGKFIYPDQFIPAIEKSGQIIDVDYFMYEEVFRYIGNRLSKGMSMVPISMNVSRQHLLKLDIVPFIRDLMDKYAVPPQYLEFELTETVCMEDSQKTMEFIQAFHDMGIKVSMDDFGTGYSSLNLLSTIPIDVIKLDKSFLKSSNLQKRERIILSNVVNLAKELEMISLCEGVETLQQSEFLKVIGCDIQQGFYYSRPISREDFDRLL